MAELSTAWCAHCFQYLYQSVIRKAHCDVELIDSLSVPEDLGSYLVLLARAFEWSQHAAGLRYWWQLEMVLRVPKNSDPSVSLKWAGVVVAVELVLRFARIGCPQRRCMIKLSLQL